MGSFGEVALSYTNRRTATIVCSKPTIFLTLNKTSFGSILESAKNMTVDLLELIKSRYPGIFQSHLADIMCHLHEKDIGRGTFLMTYGKKVDFVYIIKQGTAKVTHPIAL